MTWNTDEPSTSLVEYGRTTTLGDEASATALSSKHSVELSGLLPNTTYRFRVTSVDAAGNSATSPAAAGHRHVRDAGRRADRQPRERVRRRHRQQHVRGRERRRHRRRGAAPARRGQRVRGHRPAARLVLVELVDRRHASLTSDGALVADGALAGTDARYSALRRRSSSPRSSSRSTTRASASATTVQRLPDGGVHDRRQRRRRSGSTRRPATSGGPPLKTPVRSARRRRPVRAAPLPDRVAADARSTYFVDGAQVAAHRTASRSSA